MKKIILISVFLSQILSCADGLYNELKRPSADPELSVPIVNSFSEEGIIGIEWKDDILADEYILYRALDSTILNFQEIYRGVDCEYRDSDGIEEYLYHYSLAKVRGLKVFDRSSPVFGVFSMTTKDFFEDNDTKENATLLEKGTLITANLYGYCDSFDSKLIDEDWYRIKVPAGSTAFVVVRQLIPLASDGTANHFKSYLEGQPAVSVIDGRDINIINGFNEKTDFFLKIFPNPTKYFDDPGPGGEIVSYQISINRVE
jgi:hypothetical protein